MDHPRAGLRYVDADDLDDSTFDFDGINVESHTGDKLGDVDGFIIDVNSARAYYVVVEAGGWFTSKHFLLPIGHVSLDRSGKRLVADIDRDRVAKFPGFDRGEFEKLSDADLSRMDQQMTAACCPDQKYDAAESARRYETYKHYENATWWDSSYYRPDRVDHTAQTIASTAPMASTVTSRTAPARDREATREAVIARSDDDTSAGDVSPHLGGRAQPGDVLGVETGGERTYVGDTSEDENTRRRDAERDAAKNRD